MYTCSIQRFKIVASFCSWAGWIESYLVENPRRHIFAWCGSDKKYAWDDTKKDQYIFNLNGAENDFLNLSSNLMQAREPGDIDENVSIFFNLMEKGATLFSQKSLQYQQKGVLIQIITINQTDHGSTKNAKHCEIAFIGN